MKERVIDHLQKRSQQIADTSAYMMQQTRDWQLIRDYLSNRYEEMELTPGQQKKLERYQFAYNQMISGKYTMPGLVNMMMKLYNIKQSQAYEDIRNCKEIFTSVINLNKTFELQAEIEITKQMRAEARAMGDYRSAAALGKNLKDLMALIPEREENPADMFTGHIIEAVFDPSLIGAPRINAVELLKAINEGRTDKLNLDQITSLPFEMINKQADAENETAS